MEKGSFIIISFSRQDQITSLAVWAARKRVTKQVYKILLGKSEERNHFEGLSADGR